jgi:hypothetical protein
METNEEMTQDNENNTNSPDSGRECCSSGSGGYKSLKTALFLLVIVAACAVAAHSVLSNGSNSPCGGSATGLCPLSKPCGSSSACGLKAAGAENSTCINKEKANTPPSCCPGTQVPSCCPNAGSPDCCANTETPSGCPKTENPGGCPKTAAVPDCCPSVGSE